MDIKWQYIILISFNFHHFQHKSMGIYIHTQITSHINLLYLTLSLRSISPPSIPLHNIHMSDLSYTTRRPRTHISHYYSHPSFFLPFFCLHLITIIIIIITKNPCFLSHIPLFFFITVRVRQTKNIKLTPVPNTKTFSQPNISGIGRKQPAPTKL